MIYLYSGTPGSGKSLHAARNIYYELKLGKTVVANFPINTNFKGCKGEFIYLPNEEITPDKLIEIAKDYFSSHKFKESDLNVYLDECQLLFNAREWQKTGRAEWLSFFTQHRKFGIDIILIAQFDRMIDRQIRSLIEYESIHRKLSNFGLKGKILSLFFGGSAFLYVKIWYPLNEKVSSEIFKYSRKYAKIYNTYSILDSSSNEITSVNIQKVNIFTKFKERIIEKISKGLGFLRNFFRLAYGKIRKNSHNC